MRKITNFIVEKRNLFLILFIILTIINIYLSGKINVNEDIMAYLPSTSETKIGKDIMDREFSEQDSSVLNVMFKDLSEEEKKITLKKLEEIEGVKSVDYENTKDYNKNNYTLYSLNVDDYDHSKTALKVYNNVKNNFDIAAMSGSIYDENKPILQNSTILIAIASAMIILIILSESYVEPFLYLITIGMAVIINKGSNIMFSSVSSITNSITAILQLALSMDYSIMLSNRFKQEKEKTSNKIAAMKNALYESFKSISSSSITTIVGLLALVFMSFTIGRDLGIVLSKGVLLSLLSIFLCLPALLLLFDGLITKTHKKTPKFNLSKLGSFSYKTRWLQTIAIIIIFVTVYFLKGNINILYTASEQDEVGKIFPATNQIAIVYENKYEELIASYCKDLENDENIKDILCYSNTINEKLEYDKLNEKLESLGQDTKIDDELLKILYYNYYNKDDTNTMTLNEFISFIEKHIYSNEKFKESITNETKKSLELLSNFSTSSMINKKRSINEIASLLNINKNDAYNILIYYNSKSIDTELTIKQFVDFMLNDIQNDPNYSKNLDSNTIKKLKQLQTFANTSQINKKMNSKELSNIFGIQESLIDQLLLFYRTQENTDTKMTINTFSNTSLNLYNKDNYKYMFNEEMISSLNLLKLISDEKIINNELDVSEMKKTLATLGLNLNDEELKMLYILYDGYNTNTKITLNNFAITALELSKNEKYSSFFNDEAIYKLNKIVDLNKYKDTPMKNKELFSLFGITDKTKVYTLGIILKPYDGHLTPKKFVNILLESKLIIKSLTQEEIDELKTAKYIMDNTETKYTKSELKDLLSQDETTVSIIYGIIDSNNNNIKNISTKNFINFIYNNKSDQFILPYVKDNIDLLNLSYKIVNNTKTTYNYSEISNLMGIDKEKTKKIFGVYNYLNNETKLTPLQLTNLILNNLDNELLKNKIDNDSIKQLKLIKKIMDDTLKNTKYSSTELSNLLGIENNTTSLLLSIYNSKYIKLNEKVSLYNYINFIIKDVMNNKEYSSKFDKATKNKLSTINTIMSMSLNNEKYTSKDLFNTLKVLDNKLNKNLIDLIYIYNGSKNKYNSEWQMTIEEFINYLNHDILNDSKFNNFIDRKMNEKIKNSKELIDKSKKLIVSNNYSRAVLNTTYPFETSETFNFINEIEKNLGNKDGIYIVGNSPMAVEMSQTFNSELNKITALTMIFIFIVVAITFKDLLIPLLLVLIIQCAVYITMSFISVTGGSVYFISLLIVQAILMGATIDYAIVYTSYYKESRKTMNIKDSIINSYNKSIHTIISSASVLIIVTLIVASFASAITAKICETISQGALASSILILLILPGILAASDKLICRKTHKNFLK